ncbi:unnamed protein product [Allacma fusca]|uniref:Uncharacterized protein n=1 Tax=Allacma fusca TaxID=39272 RepID=A0A8J2JMB5_9HEXA|nr:unnamed protein product [Allacma fusca]
MQGSYYEISDEIDRDRYTTFMVMDPGSPIGWRTGEEEWNVAWIQMCEIMLKSSQFQSWVQISHFDLIVFDKSSMSDCAFALSYKWQSKVVSYSGIGCLIAWDSYSYGIPIESSWIPSFDVHYETREMTFYERASTEISFLSWYYNYYNYYLPRIDRLVRDYLDVEGMPPIHDVITSEQLIFMNIHYSDQFPRSLPPFVIPVGGMHLTEQHGALSQELNTFINAGGDEGFMYISFGSIVSISSMPEHLLKNFLSAVRESKLQFVWKWEGVHPKNIPENLLLLPWIPQKILLAHPRIRGFITQGGQVSIQEAIYNAVPVIIIPVNGDQDYNAKRVRVMGNGIEVELYGMTSEVLSDAISRLLEDKRYAKMAKILSIASRERPVAALETAVWWTEFILRNDRNVTDILKPFCRHQPWWMKRSLDVWGFLFLSVILVFAAELSSEFAGEPLSPEFAGAELSPESAGAELSPEFAGEELSSEFAGAELSPEFAGEELSPEFAGAELSPESAGAELSPEFAGDELSPELAGAELSPESAGAEFSPEFAGAELSPEFAGAELSPESAGAELSPEFAGAELSPEFAGAELSPESAGAELSAESAGAEFSP